MVPNAEGGAGGFTTWAFRLGPCCAFAQILTMIAVKIAVNRLSASD